MKDSPEGQNYRPGALRERRMRATVKGVSGVSQDIYSNDSIDLLLENEKYNYKSMEFHSESI